RRGCFVRLPASDFQYARRRVPTNELERARMGLERRFVRFEPPKLEVAFERRTHRSNFTLSTMDDIVFWTPLRRPMASRTASIFAVVSAATSAIMSKVPLIAE